MVRDTTSKEPSETTVRLHRVLLDAPDGLDVDHANRNPLDNRRKNIRLATRSQNVANRRRPRHANNPYRGVWQHKNRFVVYVSEGGKRKYLGSFETAEEAARHYDKYVLDRFGEFAVLNFPETP